MITQYFVHPVYQRYINIYLSHYLNAAFTISGDVTDDDIDVVVQSLLTSGSLMTWKFVARKLGLREGEYSH